MSGRARVLEALENHPDAAMRAVGARLRAVPGWSARQLAAEVRVMLRQAREQERKKELDRTEKKD